MGPRVALVAGASRGIGRGIALGLRGIGDLDGRRPVGREFERPDGVTAPAHWSV